MTMITSLPEYRGFGALPQWGGLPPGNPPAEIPSDSEPDNSPPSPPTEAPEPDLPDVDPGGLEELPDREPDEAPDLPPELPPGRLRLSEPRPIGAAS